MADVHGIADDQVRSAFQRWKNLEEEKARIGDDLKELFAEQKSFGHDTKAMRAAFRLKVKMDEARPEDAEHEALVDTYLAALEAPRASRAYARENIEKFGTMDGGVRTDGPAIDFGTARIMEEQREVAMRSDGGLSILTKHEDIRTAPVTAEEAEPEAAAEVAGNDLREPVAAGQGQIIREGDAPRETGRHDDSHASCPDTEFSQPETAAQCAAPEKDAAADERSVEAAGVAALVRTISPEEAEAESPSAERGYRAAANAGGDHVTSIAKREVEFDRNPNTGEGDAFAALPANAVTMEYCPPTGVKRSSFAHCFPEPSKDQRAALERDIIDNRVQVPIVRQGNLILDGWARYTIARSLGQSYPVKEYDGGDELLDVIEWQRASRNFTQAQEKKIAADLAKAMPDRADDIMAAFNLAEELEAAE